MKKVRHTKQSGFTLVELLVATTIFTLIMVSAVGAVYTSNAAAKRAQSMGVVLSNLNFAVESISRNIRTGDSYYCSSTVRPNTPSLQDCASSDTGITIHSSLGQDRLIYYYYDATDQSIKKQTNPAQPDGSYLAANWSSPVALTAVPEVKIQRVLFQVVGTGAADNLQPRIFINIVGTAVTNKDTIPFNVQTLVSQRNAE